MFAYVYVFSEELTLLFPTHTHTHAHWLVHVIYPVVKSTFKFGGTGFALSYHAHVYEVHQSLSTNLFCAKLPNPKKLMLKASAQIGLSLN